MAATPAMGDAMAIMVVLVLEPLSLCMASLLAAFCRVAVEEPDVGSAAAAEVGDVEVRRVVVKVVKEGVGVENCVVVGELGGNDAVPVDEMREATDCTKDDVGVRVGETEDVVKTPDDDG